MRKEVPAPKKYSAKGRYQAHVDAAFASVGEWIAEDYPELLEKRQPNAYAQTYAAIGRRFADVRMQDGTLYVRINE